MNPSSRLFSAIKLRFLFCSISLIAYMEAIPVYAQPSVGISSSVQPFVDRHEVAGAVMLVADKDEILTLEATGWADIANNKKMQPDSMFWIASQSKPITSAAFMMLVDEGKVKLDDPVEKYLPEFKGQMVVAEQDNEHIVLHKPQHPFTIREALSHRSGLPFKSLVEEPTLDIYPLEARVRSYAMTNLQYEPGTDYLYSNAGINTVARIIEVITKMPYEQFLDERLIQPLGMKDTTFWPNEEQAARIAKAYKPGKDNMGLDETKIVQLYYPLTDHTHRTPMPGGGLFSTAHDVSRFYRMMLNKGELDGKRYLSEDAVKELTSRQTPETMKNSYGLGFTVNKTTFGHGGAYSTGTNADTASDLITIWLVQHAAFPGEGVKAQGTFQNAAKNKFAAVQAK